MTTVQQTPFRSRGARRSQLAIAVCAVTLALLSWAASSAHADAPRLLASSSFTDSLVQAGAHPDVTTTFDVTSTHDNQGTPRAAGALKDVVVDLPRGLIGDPQATPKCPVAGLESNTCAAKTQVGVLNLRMPNGQAGDMPIYNVEPPPGQVATFGFSANNAPLNAPAAVIMAAEVRTGDDYGVTIRMSGISQAYGIGGTTVTFWGIPADHNGGGAERKPFLTNPTECGVPLTTTLHINTWQGGTDSETFPPTTMTGCENLPFAPSLTVQPDTTQIGQPSGYSVTLGMSQSDDPDGLADSALKDVSVTMPEGLSISPGLADGLAACDEETQFRLESKAPVACPDASKIGTVSLLSPLLPDALEGSIFVGEQEKDDFAEPDHPKYHLYIVAAGHGVTIKLRGLVQPDPRTGQLTTVFEKNPPLPFSTFTLHFDGGPRAALANPEMSLGNPNACGTKTATSSMTPYSSAVPATASSSFTIDGDGNGGACASPGWSPAFVAGTTNPVAGATSPFTLRVTRPDGQQTLSRIDTVLPAGLLGRLSSVPLCSAAAGAAGTCGAASQVGTTTVSSGSGPNPFFLNGKVFLTDGFDGHPFGLSIVVPVIAGPFNLGNVVVRAAVDVDATDAHIRVVSDPLPTIVKGIPLRLRSVNVTIDRPGFMVNPTSCAPTAVYSQLWSSTGTVANAGSRFQVGGCSKLGFAPRMGMRLTNKSQVTDGKHPGLDVLVTQGAGQANLKKVVVKLPLSLALDPEHSKSDSLCSFTDGLKGKCPVSSEIGTAEAVSPLLNKHLYGKVYFVKGLRLTKQGHLVRSLPTLLIPLRGEINLDLRATSEVDSDGRLVTTFANIPDAALSGFRLQLRGGKKGILVVTGKQNLCRGEQVTEAQTEGQNAKTRDLSVTMKTPCASAKARTKR